MDVGSTPTISSFNAINNLDNGRRTPTKRKLCFMGSSANELRLESFAKDEVLKHNSELPLNANRSRQVQPTTLKKGQDFFVLFYYIFVRRYITNQIKKGNILFLHNQIRKFLSKQFHIFFCSLCPKVTKMKFWFICNFYICIFVYPFTHATPKRVIISFKTFL